MTDKPIKTITSYLTGKPYNDITFRFRFDAKFEGRTYNVVIDVTYGK
jgi:hypothetical protein